eukprot:SAG22_NODE_140_length_17982_cov_81.438741_3_plen_587_part_00
MMACCGSAPRQKKTKSSPRSPPARGRGSPSISPHSAPGTPPRRARQRRDVRSETGFLTRVSSPRPWKSGSSHDIPELKLSISLAAPGGRKLRRLPSDAGLPSGDAVFTSLPGSESPEREGDQQAALRERVVFPTGAKLLPQWKVRPVPGSQTGAVVRLFKASYAANDPSEDRSCVAVGDDFVWAAVFDGHAGPQCAAFCEQAVWRNFKDAMNASPPPGQDVPVERAGGVGGGSAAGLVPKHRTHHLVRAASEDGWFATGSGAATAAAGGAVGSAFASAYRRTDAQYLAYAGDDKRKLFSGSCAASAHLDLETRTVSVGNLGDSRVVSGIFESAANGTKQLRCVELSVDHSAMNASERARIAAEHPAGPETIVNAAAVSGSHGGAGGEAEAEWRVKGLCAFTRSIGDHMMKDGAAAALYNSLYPVKVEPKPGDPVDAAAPEKGVVQPYLCAESDFRQLVASEESFVVIACDGVWDEMTSEEAVELMASLLATKPEADVARLFVDEVLKKAAARCAAAYPEERGLTLPELKARPLGKQNISHRSELHDDITVVVVQFAPDAGPPSHQTLAAIASGVGRRGGGGGDAES